eukprot:5268532-Prymnesium_polylepis.1
MPRETWPRSASAPRDMQTRHANVPPAACVLLCMDSRPPVCLVRTRTGAFRPSTRTALQSVLRVVNQPISRRLCLPPLRTVR